MRTLQRNKRSFFYAPYLRKEREGNGYKPVFGDAIELSGNISAATGSTHSEQFGNNIEYDRVIVLDECPFEESAILFIDIEPEKNGNGDYIYDYIVKKIARSLNSVSVAISRVSVS